MSHGHRPLNGADYVALRRLSDRDDRTLAQVGETCDRVPPASLPALLASGKIAPVVSKPDAPDPVSDTAFHDFMTAGPDEERD